MSGFDITDVYRRYLACLNAQDWPNLGTFVDDNVTHNGRAFGLSGYRGMLEQNFVDIPDLQFGLLQLVADPPTIASRLQFDCTPQGHFLGLNVDGKRVAFTENVFYTFSDGKIIEVWSIVDKAAIEAQL